MTDRAMPSDETLAEEFSRLVSEYNEPDTDGTRDEAWNLIADFAIANAAALTAALAVREGVEVVPYPPIVISTGLNGVEHRVGVHEYRTADRDGGVITIAIYMGDHKWIEAELDPSSAKTVSNLILSKPCLASPALDGGRE